MSNPSEGFERVLATLDQLEIAYEIGGSVASSVYGLQRSTYDVDFVTALSVEQVDEFASLLGPEFYADPQTMRDAIRLGRPFNVLHKPSVYKFDFFPLRSDEYSRTEFNRRRFADIRSFGPDPVECAISSPEDILLRKLEWYRAGGGASERQWSDLLGIVEVSGHLLDLEYLRKWAEYLKVADLLARLLSDSPL